MNSYLLTAIILFVLVGIAMALLLRYSASKPPVLHPGWDDLPTPEPPPTGDLAVARESTPRSPTDNRNAAGAPLTIGTYRVVCGDCRNTIQVSPIRGASIETKSLCAFCASRLRIDVPGRDEDYPRTTNDHVTPDFRH